MQKVSNWELRHTALIPYSSDKIFKSNHIQTLASSTNVLIKLDEKNSNLIVIQITQYIMVIAMIFPPQFIPFISLCDYIKKGHSQNNILNTHHLHPSIPSLYCICVYYITQHKRPSFK